MEHGTKQPPSKCSDLVQSIVVGCRCPKCLKAPCFPCFKIILVSHRSTNHVTSPIEQLVRHFYVAEVHAAIVRYRSSYGGTEIIHASMSSSDAETVFGVVVHDRSR